ncbi:MAG: restriction endonuclease subunit S, partial [Isosphaeraceae bacterium]
MEWIGLVPSHWKIRRFRYSATIPNGQVDPRLPDFADQLLIAPNHIESGTGRLLEYRTADEQAAISGKYQFKKGEVLYSKIRPELAKACVAPFDGLCSADMYPLRPRCDLSAGYLAYLLICPGFTEIVVLRSARVAMPKVNREELGDCSVIVPPREDQDAIIRFLDRETAKLDALIAKKQRLIELLQEKRTALISHAVTKGLDPGVPMKESGVS